MGLLDIQPHKVSRDLKGYCVVLYGEIKTGKTTTATRFPKHALLAFEKGYNAIPGAMALPINSWGEFKKELRTLKKPAAKERFETIIVDTADIAYEYCEKYIASQQGVQTIKDVEWGQGYGLVEREFDGAMRDIVKMGYGLVLISHSTDKVFKDENGEEYNQITTTLDKRGHKVVSRMADILGFIKNMDGTEDYEPHVRMFMRGTPRYVAGSRFEHIVPSIEFNYENLVNAIGDAVDELEKEYGVESVVDVGENLYEEKERELTFDELQKELAETIVKLLEEDPDYWKPHIAQIAEANLGTGKKIQDATPMQYEMVEMCLLDVRELISNKK